MKRNERRGFTHERTEPQKVDTQNDKVGHEEGGQGDQKAEKKQLPISGSNGHSGEDWLD